MLQKELNTEASCSNSSHWTFDIPSWYMQIRMFLNRLVMAESIIRNPVVISVVSYFVDNNSTVEHFLYYTIIHLYHCYCVRGKGQINNKNIYTKWNEKYHHYLLTYSSELSTQSLSHFSEYGQCSQISSLVSLIIIYQGSSAPTYLHWSMSVGVWVCIHKMLM